MPDPISINPKALDAEIRESGLLRGFIAKHAGITPWRLSRMLSGQATPTDAELRLLAAVLRVPFDDFARRVCSAGTTQAPNREAA